MFAVPGWSVSADKLKLEIARPASNEPTASKPKKRKRRESSNSANVNAANLADLWEQVIEHKKPSSSRDQGEEKDHDRKKSKRQRRKDEDADHGCDKDSAVPQAAEGGKSKAPEQSASTTPVSPKKQKEKHKGKSGKHESRKAAGGVAEKPRVEQASKTSDMPPPPAAKLTPLQASMREKLTSARFRHLNETLYTRPSAEAYQLFQESPDMFDEYHEGFRRQVGVWPENPVDGYIRDIQQRGRQRPWPRGVEPLAPPPLPRTAGTCTIADLGCGDARLAASLGAARRKLRLEILSYDLRSPSRLVTRADIASLPLADGAVDVAVFCLALMGTNWADFVEEAYRVLRWKGELWVAEIKSRFGTAGGRTKKAPRRVVEHSVGGRRKGKAGRKDDGGEKANDEADEAALAIEVDGAEDGRDQTDVSAFVEALRRRGFLLQGEAGRAVDLSNKMFVKMRFIKAAPPTRGKGVARQREAGGGAPPRKKFTDVADPDEGEADESEILKPCVYKLR